MALILLSITLIFLINSPKEVVNSDIVSEKDSTIQQNIRLQQQNIAFKDGEVLTFRIRYGFITAGTAKMKVFKENYMDSIPVYHLKTTAKSASAFNWIYEVNDVVSSFVDYKNFYPIRFEKRLREGSYKADLVTDYIPEDSLAKVEFIRYRSNMKIKKKSNYDVKVPPFSQDVLSSLYYIYDSKNYFSLKNSFTYWHIYRHGRMYRTMSLPVYSSASLVQA